MFFLRISWNALVQVKERQGSIERMQPDGITAVCKGLFKKETDISVFTGLKV
jgi:selenocysteine-specific elongation factor